MARLQNKSLTAEQKIKILERTRKILGPNGDNWIKGTWFARKEKSFTPGATRRRWGSEENWSKAPPSEANCWCLLGAMEEAAHQLGYSKGRTEGSMLGALTSLKKLAYKRLNEKAMKKFGYKMKSSARPLHVFNDSAETEWKDVKKLIADRLKQLRAGEE